MNTTELRDKIEATELQIYEVSREIRYSTRELTIEDVSKKFTRGLEYSEDEETEWNGNARNVLFVPEYQRDFTWDIVRQSKFIESLIIGLPIPTIFVAQRRTAAWEIVDGSQRIRTIHAFVSGQLKLEKLEKLDKLNGFTFNNLDITRKGKILDIYIRMIVLSEETTDEIKKDLFDRINRGSDLLKPMETRKGIFKGPLTDFIYSVCNNDKEVAALFEKLAPIDKWLTKRQEREELFLRFLALSANKNYFSFPKDTGIAAFLNDFLEKENKRLENMDVNSRSVELKSIKKRFLQVLHFVDTNFEFGFRKTHNPQTKRVIFEAISVGVSEALNLGLPEKINKVKWREFLDSDDFKSTWYPATGLHNTKRVRDRVEIVKNKLLSIKNG